MRLLLATSCLTTLAVVAAVPAAAETVISTAVTTPVATGTANDLIRISSTGSVKPAAGNAVTINSNHGVTNEGAIQLTGVNNVSGIFSAGGFTGNISNSATGTITLDEAYTPTDSDNDGDIDGAFAQGTGRFGIRIGAGGAHTGNISHAGTITIEGNASAGIQLESALTGNLTSSGAINVLGDNSAGIRTGAVNGNLVVSKGAISVRGANSVGVLAGGDIGGAIVVQGGVATSGYRATTAPADASKLDADDLLQGGSAVVVAGNVAGGVLFDAPPTDSNPNNADEDADGTPDAQETTANIATFGSAPAVVVGSATQAVTLGQVGTTGRGLVNRGTIVGNGVYKGVSGTGVQIGGTGQAVTVTGGLLNSGNIGGAAVEANAVALRLGAGATTPLLDNSGIISASGGGTDATGATALLIQAGASLPTLRNSGQMTAVRNGDKGTASVIVDQSGTLSLIENSGAIAVSGATTLGDKATAIDVSANGGGVTIRQLVAAAGKAAPGISGRILFGAGSDLLDVADGSVNGNVSFGTGDNRLQLSGDAIMIGNASFGGGADQLSLAGTSQLTGNLDLGGGADVLTLAGTSLFRGQLSGAAGTAVTVGAGTTLDATNIGTVALGSLSVGNGATLGVTIGDTSHTLYNVAGAASFGTGGKVAVTLTRVGDVEGTYTIVQAGSLTGGSDLTPTIGTLPYLFDSTISTATPGEVRLNLRVKTAAELGLNESESALLPALLEVVDGDTGLAGALLDIGDQESLQDTLQLLLPEHSGGAFESVTRGLRLTSRLLLDPLTPTLEQGRLGMWFGQVAWGSSKAIGSTSAYRLGGWGANAGAEYSLGGVGAVGATLGYLSGRDRKTGDELTSSQIGASLYWRGGSGPLKAYAQVGASTIGFEGTRSFSAIVGNETVTREATRDWRGTTMSATLGASYDLAFGSRFTVRPTAIAEFNRLKEKGYEEEGGTDAFNLIVDGRTSSEAAVTGALALGYDLLGNRTGGDRLRVELEGGYRAVVGGKLGATTARFDGGTPFTLRPEEREGGFVGALRVFGGGSAVSLGAELNAEQLQGRVGVGGKASIRLAM